MLTVAKIAESQPKKMTNHTGPSLSDCFLYLLLRCPLRKGLFPSPFHFYFQAISEDKTRHSVLP